VGVSDGANVAEGVGVLGIGEIVGVTVGLTPGGCADGLGEGPPAVVGSSRFDNAAIARITPRIANATNPPPR
jgi:hypothetical protein